jgi:hypothetical protein
MATLLASPAPSNSLSTLVAVVSTPNPGAQTLPPSAWSPPSRNDTQRQPESALKMRDIKSVSLDKEGKWEPMTFFDKKFNKALLVGVYIPIVFDVVTEQEQKQLKRFSYKVDPHVRMNFPIGVPKDDEGKDKKQYTMPDATFSLDETTNKNVFDDVGYMETKIHECLDTNADFIRQKCDALKREHRKLVDPNAPKPVFHPIIGTSKGRGPKHTGR